MPYEIQWHANLPILIIRLKGTFSLADYRRYSAARADLLNGSAEKMVVLLDAQGFEGFSEARTLNHHESLFDYQGVLGVVVVLGKDLYARLARSFFHDEARVFRAYLFADEPAALEAAQRML